MGAVAPWDRLPTADELLERRVEAGWHPVPSPLKEGPTVLGHAACLTKRPAPPGADHGGEPG